MKFYARLLTTLLLTCSLPALAQTPAPVASPPPAETAVAPAPALQFYKYAHNDAEYSVALPEAPQVKTIWADEEKVPYLEHPPLEGNLGEVATFRRIDAKTEETFDVKITFLKADDKFLAGLTEEKMKAALEDDYKGATLDNKDWHYSAGGGSLKWATLSGFSVDKSNRPYFNAEHYLTGKQSIMVIKVQYNVENQSFGEYYKALTDNIAYLSQ